MSDDTSKLLKACVEYRAMVDKLEAENAELREALSDDACREIMRLRSENAALREDSKIVDELCALHGCGREFLLVWCRAAAYAQKAYTRKEAQP